MEFKKLLKAINYTSIHNEIPKDITGIAYDSRKVKRGDLFVAIQGEKKDGIKYENDAVIRGAACVVAKEYNRDIQGICQVIVEDPRISLSLLAKEFYKNPSSRLCVVGVTGTNGKTTITYLIENIFRIASRKPVIIGTVNYRFMDQRKKAVNTTPESLDINQMMSEYLSQGATDLIMEVSSHAISQHRVNGINFDIAIFTNLTQDHLDYHKTMENYYAAKAQLFEKILPVSNKDNKFAILNSDDPWVKRINIKKGIHVLKFGISSIADTRLIESSVSLDGIKMNLSTPIGIIELSSALVGYYNIYNIMAAVSAAIVAKVDYQHIKQGIESLTGVPGRVERVNNPKGIYAFVDYAHTPDALEKVLRALAGLKKRKLITVFGCGGDRDKGKRPIMGDIAARLSDLTIITSDNPRSEASANIIYDIEQGIKGVKKATDTKDKSTGKIYTVIEDRKDAIKAALDIAENGDVVLIAGKGHEDYQIFSDKTIHFSDREEIMRYFGLLE